MQHDARTDAAQKTLIVLLDRLKSFVDDEAPDQWDLKIEVATLRASVEAVLQMNPSGAAHLHCALMTAFSIGGRVFRTETALQEEVGLSADAVDERRRKMGIPSRRKKSKK